MTKEQPADGCSFLCHFRYMKIISEFGKRAIRKVSSTIQKHRKPYISRHCFCGVYDFVCCFIRNQQELTYEYSDYYSMLSISFSQTLAEASLGIRQSPRGESVTVPTFGPSGRHDRLNCCAKNRRQKVFNHFKITSFGYASAKEMQAMRKILDGANPQRST